MRKSLFFAALAFPFMVACDDGVDLTLPEKAGPFGVDMSGTWSLQNINGSLPFQFANTTSGSGASLVTFTNTITGGTMTMLYNKEKDWEAYYSYRQTGTNGSLVVRDSIRRGKYYTTSSADGVNAITLQVDLPATGIYGPGRVTNNNTTFTHYNFATSALSVTTTQLWQWGKQ
jgi:hypothetical protein